MLTGFVRLLTSFSVRNETFPLFLGAGFLAFFSIFSFSECKLSTLILTFLMSAALTW